MYYITFNPEKATKNAMRKITQGLGKHYEMRTRFNFVTQRAEEYVWFKDAQRGIIVPPKHRRQFNRFVQQNFDLGHERNIDWRNS